MMDEKTKEVYEQLVDGFLKAVHGLYPDEVLASRKFSRILHLLYIELCGAIQTINPLLFNKLDLDFTACQKETALYEKFQQLCALFVVAKGYPEFKNLTPESLVASLFKIEKQIFDISQSGLAPYLDPEPA